MKWNDDLSGATEGLAWRWAQLRRQLVRLLALLALGLLLAFLLAHPAGRRLAGAGAGTVQGGWQAAERQLHHLFGPALLLRLRAEWAVAGLADELVALQALERRAAAASVALEGELPQLIERQEALQEEMSALTAQLRQQEALVAVALHPDAYAGVLAPAQPANVSAQVLTYLDLAEQVARRRQALRVLTATEGQSRALQLEAHQVMADAGAVSELFAARLHSGERTEIGRELTAAELLALRGAFERQISGSAEIRRQRRTLESDLNALNLPAEPPDSEQNRTTPD
jgi:hypothetical protein